MDLRSYSKFDDNHCAFLVATCEEPIHPGNRRNPSNQRVIGFLPYGARVNGRFPEGTEAYFECELGIW